MKVMLAAVSETCKKKGCCEADLPNNTDTILTSCQAHVDSANVLVEKAKHCMKSTLFECFDELSALRDAIDETSKIWNEQYQALIFESKSQGNENRKEYQAKRWLLQRVVDLLVRLGHIDGLARFIGKFMATILEVASVTKEGSETDLQRFVSGKGISVNPTLENFTMWQCSNLGFNDPPPKQIINIKM